MGARRALSALWKGGTAAALAVCSTACEPSSLSSGRDAFGAATPSATTLSATPEAKRLAQDVGGFIAASAPGNSAYQIGAQDVLEVVVFKAPELTRSVQVADGGTINLPLVGEIVAAGKTSAQVERELASRLGATYMRNPQVNVYVKEFNSQRVTVEGAVKTPGVYPLRGKTSLMQALATAQGTDRDVASSNVMVFRTVDDQRVAAEFDVDAIRSGQAQDPLLRNGDVVVVPTSGSKVVFQNFIKITPLLAAFRPSVL